MLDRYKSLFPMIPFEIVHCVLYVMNQLDITQRLIDEYALIGSMRVSVLMKLWLWRF